MKIIVVCVLVYKVVFLVRFQVCGYSLSVVVLHLVICVILLVVSIVKVIVNLVEGGL